MSSAHATKTHATCNALRAEENMSAGRNKNSKTRIRKLQRLRAGVERHEHKVMLRKKRKEDRHKRRILLSK